MSLPIRYKNIKYSESIVRIINKLKLKLQRKNIKRKLN